MRNLVWYLAVVGALFLFAMVVLPILGMLLAVVGVLIAVSVATYIAAPFLAKLPWFRDRIRVERQGGRRTVRFGGAQFTSYQNWGGPSEQPHSPQQWDTGVIDVEGRPLSAEDDEAEAPQVLPPPRDRDRS